MALYGLCAMVSGAEPTGDAPLPPDAGSGDVSLLPPVDGSGGEPIPPAPPAVGPPADQSGFRLPPADDLLPAPAALPVPEVAIRSVLFEGNTVVRTEELESLCGDIACRPATEDDIENLRLAATRLYLSKGYINSGAVIPDQDLSEGTLVVKIVEGRLCDAVVRHFRINGRGETKDAEGRNRLATSYLRDRVMVGADKPLHFPTLQQRLQLLQTNRNILRVNAELKPGPVPGEALLDVGVTEPPGPLWKAGFDFHNQRPPSVGGEQGECWVSTDNLTGICDPLVLRLGLFTGDRGSFDFAPGNTASLFHERPVTARDTMLGLKVSRQDYAVLDPAFSALQIGGESVAGGLWLRHPLWRSIRQTQADGEPLLARWVPWACCGGTGGNGDPSLTIQDEVWVSLGFDYSHSTTELLGRRFSTAPGYVDGELDLAVLRFSQEWTRRTDDSVLGMRSVFSLGLPGAGATDAPSEPDAEFVLWKLHGQLSTRVSDHGDMLRMRTGFQWSDGPLPSPEQWLLGGMHTVRGYRENALVRDMGCFASVEYALPLPLPDTAGRWRVELVPFVDWGMGWNARGAAERVSLTSAGVGLRAEYGGWFRGELFWGVPFDRRDLPGQGDLQDAGLHFTMSVMTF